MDPRRTSHRIEHGTAGVAAIPSGRAGRALARGRARLRRRTLDEQLASGADPWSSATLLARAEHLVSPAHRDRLATALERLIPRAERRHVSSAYLEVRDAAVLRERETLTALAARLRATAPVDVAAVARLSLLAWDELSPVFVGGRPVETFHETVALCASVLLG